MKWFFLILLFLVAALYIFIQTPFGQNWIARQVTKRLSRDLQARISIDHVDFSLFNRMHLRGLLLEDRKGDTLLYAGDLQVRITDWFFFKKEADLKYIGLENALVKFQRTDSAWNQQFIFDYFSSPSAGSSKKKAGIRFNLKKVELANVTFLKKDRWDGQDMTIHVGVLSMDADKLSLSGNQYEINSLFIKEPYVAISNYTQLKPGRNEAGHSDEGALSWNSGKTIFRIGDLKIDNGVFKNDKETDRETLPGFDGQHILFTDINGEWIHSSFEGDTILSKLKLSAKERSGLEVKHLTADVKMTPQGMAFSNLDLATNRSTIRNFFSMSYHDMDDLGSFIHRVKMAANFDDSYVDSDDIAFFAPSLKTWKKKITLRGKVRGSVDELVGKDMLVQAGSSTLLNGDISLTGLPDIEQTFIDFKANDFRTTYADALAIIPAVRKVTVPDLKKISYVNFKGSFTGFIRDFVTFGTLETNLGTARTDLNMKLPYGREPIYSGNISTDNFRLGQFLGDPRIGAISITAAVKGTGFSEKTRNTSIDGTIRFVEYNNYRYNNIAVNGKLDKRLFKGDASIRDDHANMDLSGIIDFNGKTPRFNLLAKVDHADLKSLGLTQDSITFKGKADLDFTSDNFDNFLGKARLTDAELTRNGHRLPFDSLIIESAYVNGQKQFNAVSNEFDATLSGNFKLNDLPGAFTFILNKYYPASIRPPKRYPPNLDLQFDINTYYYIDEYLQLIDSSLSGFSNTHLKGRLNTASGELDVSADIPQFKYRQYQFNDVNITAKGNVDNLLLKGRAAAIKINDSITIPNADFTVRSRQDSSRVSITTGATQAVEKADLNALVLSYNDGVKIEFEPSSFTINGKTWTIDENGELVLRSHTPASGMLALSEGDQKIVLRTQPSSNGNWNDIKAELTNLNVGDIAPYFLPNNRLEGLVTGTFLIENPTQNLKISSDDIHTKFLRLDNDSLGEVRASLNYDDKAKQLKINGNTLNQENYLGFDASLFFGDAEKAKNNLIALKARNFQINVLERFLGNLFSDIRGYLTGDVNISGEFDDLNVTGKGRLKDAGLRVNFTQCYYRIRDTDISLDKTKIDLDGIVLTDTVTGNPIYVSGGIEHESFRNMFYNLDISTRKPGTVSDANNRPVQLLRTSYKDNKQFYGNVKGTGSLSLVGPQSDMYMKIDAVASTRDSSFITLPPSSSRESGMAGFLVERKYGREMNETDIESGASNIIYDVDLTINKTVRPMVGVRVILDELTGDEIKGKGYGSLNIRSGTSEPLSLRGRFDIEEGSYLFTFQSFFKKPFELKRESENYIEWNGDPYDADIKFEAIYRAERVSFAPLGELLQLNSGIANARGDVFVVASLTDKLFKPSIHFSLDFPNTSVAVTDPELALVLQQMQKNLNEINRQVTYLIVFNSFAPNELGSTSSTQGLGLTTISGIFLNVISDQINKILGNLLKSDKYNISLNTSIYNRNIIDQNKKTQLQLGSNINFSIGRSFFDNRFIISTGLGYDAGAQQSTLQQSFAQQLLPDVTLEWLINQAGTIRASFFYRENTDYLTSASNGAPGKAKRIGTSLSYRKDFDRLGDIFRRKKKAKNLPPQAPATETKTGTGTQNE